MVVTYIIDVMSDKTKNLFNKYSNLYQFEEGSPEYLIDKEDFEIALKEAVKYALEQAAAKAKTTPFYRPNCDDHTPYWGTCVSCGRYDNPDVLAGEVVDKESILSLEAEIVNDLKA